MGRGKIQWGAFTKVAGGFVNPERLFMRGRSATALLLLAATAFAAVAMASQEECAPRKELAAKSFPVDADRVIAMQALASAWAGANGLQVLRPTGIEVAPVSIRPMPLPRSAYEHVKGLMSGFNEMVHKVSLDADFINRELKPVAVTDDFQRHLLEIYNTCREEGVAQPITLGIFRSDYMLHDAGDGSPLVPKQVEINTIAASFFGLSQRVTGLHRTLLGRLPLKGLEVTDCPDNSPVSGIASSIATAIRLYSKSMQISNQHVACLMVVQGDEQNVFDQRHLEFALWDNHQVPVIRATMAEIHTGARLDPASKVLHFQDTEIGCIYFRAGYQPEDYTGQNDWDARLLMERSAAVKCPSAAYHCVGAKKIQAALARPGVVEKYVSADVAARLRTVFAGMYTLGDGSVEAREAKEKALAAPKDYVLKPQREGGGNNLYDAEMVQLLSTATDEELEAYILMDIIKAPVVPSLFMRKGEIFDVKATTELGIYGTIVAEGGVIHETQTVGHLLRSKMESSKETGVAAGFGVLDSPALYDI